MRGFSLVELIVVIGVVALLAALALPVYNKYTVQSRVATTLPFIDGLVSKVSQIYATTGSMPTNTSQLGSLVTVLPPNITSAYIGGGGGSGKCITGLTIVYDLNALGGNTKTTYLILYITIGASASGVVKTYVSLNLSTVANGLTCAASGVCYSGFTPGSAPGQAAFSSEYGTNCT